ncbi:MAG TPA: DUF1579 domain-containing protein [Blastocatellia bacterium]|jgi:hypothetical protein
MKLRILIFTIALACASLLSAERGFSQEHKAGEKNAAKPAADMQEMMKKWMECATPGEAHKQLEHLVGKWDTVVKMWWQGPGKPPAETKGASETRWIMDGRFLLEESTGQMMGMPWRGMSIMGYDNFKKKYVVSYIDNMGTAMYTGEGKFDLANKVLTSFGKMDEPMTGERDKPVKYVVRPLSKDKYVFEIFDEVGSPNEFKAVEITYTRKQ